MSSLYKISTVLHEEYIVGLHSSQRNFNFKGKFLAPFQSESDVKCEYCGYCNCTDSPFSEHPHGVNGSQEPAVGDTASPQGHAGALTEHCEVVRINRVYFGTVFS